MPELIHCHQFRTDTPPSAYSPKRTHGNQTYEIHLVKSDSPAYIPSDLETWPIFYEAILKVLMKHPAAHAAAIEAIHSTRKTLQGLENRDVPPGTMPL